MIEAPRLSPDEARRYARHLVLKGIGGAGQQKLKAARVLVVGAGGLGSPAIAYLAAAGVGTLGVIDHDTVALSNLQRQIVHTSRAIGTKKVVSARDFVEALNPDIAYVPHGLQLDEANAATILANYDLVLDGSDTLSTRRVVAGAAQALRLPLVLGAVSMFDGHLTVLAPHLARPEGGFYPGFSAIYPDDAQDDDLPSCEAVGIVGAVTGVIGTLMAMEAIKLVTGFGEPLYGRLLLYSGASARFTEVGL